MNEKIEVKSIIRTSPHDVIIEHEILGKVRAITNKTGEFAHVRIDCSPKSNGEFYSLRFSDLEKDIDILPLIGMSIPVFISMMHEDE